MAASRSPSDRPAASLLPGRAAALAVVLGLVSGGAMGREERPAAGAGGEVAWRASFATAMEESRDSGRPLLLVFYTTWCQYCAKMDETTLRAPRIASTLRRFVPAMVDAEIDLVAARRFAPEGFPVVVVVDPAGREVVRFTGYRPPEEFGPALEAVLEITEPLSDLAGELESLGRDDEAARARTLSRMAELFSSRGFHGRAFGLLEQALADAGKARSPLREDLLSRAARSAGLAGLGRDADRAWKRLLKEFPDSDNRPDYLLERARALADDGRVRPAMAVLAELRERYGGSPQSVEAAELISRLGR